MGEAVEIGAVKPDNVTVNPQAIRELAAFLPRFEAPGFTFGQWEHPVSDEPGVIVMPYLVLGETARSFVTDAYADGWVLEGFDWPAWADTTEATQLREDPGAIANASPEQLAKLLTVLIRQDRFSEGSLAAAFESGLLTRIVRRAAVIASGMDDGQR